MTFRGLRYDQGLVGDYSKVITPPYDVISSEQQRAYHRKSPCNIIRLELGYELPNDSDGDNKYTRAADILREWIEGGILVREKNPALYLIEHRFPYQGGFKSYWGIVCAVRVEDLDLQTGSVRPTEWTLNTPAEDRLNLLRACQANVSPTMGVFDQGGKNCIRSLFPKQNLEDPLISAIDDKGVIFNVWVETDVETLEAIIKFFADKIIYIADGHHRYRTAATYRAEQLEAHPERQDDPFNFIMMTLVSAHDPGLSMLPIHRLVRGLSLIEMMNLKETLSDYYDIQEMPALSVEASENMRQWMEALSNAGHGEGVVGLYGLAPNKFHLLTPLDIASLREGLSDNESPFWRSLDVSVLQGVVMEKVLGIDDPDRARANLEFCPSEKEAFAKVDSGDFQLGFFLNAQPVSTIIEVADSGSRMPQKSTYFYPKTAAGLVINPLF